MSLILAALLTFALPALAVTGPSSEPGDLAKHVVMVLKRTAHGGAFCSGVVIAQDIVLTAAHCVGKAADVRVHYRDGANAPVLATIAEVAVHPGFRPNAIRTRERSVDLALVRLAQALPTSFAAADLAEGGAVSVGDRFRLAGFGVAREGADKTGGVLRLAELAVRAPLSSLLLWAEDPLGQGAGACTGDSGAPIFAPDSDKVVAITAWASGNGSQQCGALTQAVFVAPQGTWIGRVVQEWNGH
jgi:secreted trypsin-like serine protease